MIKKSLIITVSILLMTFEIQAAQKGTTLGASIHQDYVSVRALGMGNAFSAVVDDHNALFYNPAALGLRKDGIIRGYLRGGVSSNWESFFNDIDSRSNQPNDIQAITDFLNENYGESYHLGVPTIGLHWVRPGWGLAFIPIMSTVDLSVHRQVGPMITVNAFIDTVLAYGYGDKWNWATEKLGGETHWGITGKLYHRILVSESVSAADLAQDSDVVDKDSAAEGLTFDVDLGFLYSPDIKKDGWLKFAKPTFSFVVRNALDYGYITNLHVVNEESPEPENLQRRIDIGSNWDLPNFWVFDPHFSFEIRDMLHKNWSFKKGLHAGAELYWTMFSWWKGNWNIGLNQGYPTMGLGARFAFFNLDLAYYAEELGTESNPVKSEKYILEMSLEF